MLVKFTHVVTRFSLTMPRLRRSRVQRVTRLPTESPDRSNFSLVRYVVPAPCQENGDGTVLVLRAFSSIRAAAVERKYQRHVSPREMFLSTESATRLFLTSPTIFLFPPSSFFFRNHRRYGPRASLKLVDFAGLERKSSNPATLASEREQTGTA